MRHIVWKGWEYYVNIYYVNSRVLLGLCKFLLCDPCFLYFLHWEASLFFTLTWYVNFSAPAGWVFSLSNLAVSGQYPGRGYLSLTNVLYLLNCSMLESTHLSCSWGLLACLGFNLHYVRWDMLQLRIYEEVVFYSHLYQSFRAHFSLPGLNAHCFLALE